MSVDKQMQVGRLMIVPPRPTPRIALPRWKAPIGSQRQAPDQPHVWPGMQVLVIGSARAGFIAKAAERTAPDGRVIALSDDGEALRRLENRLAPLGFAHLVLETFSPDRVPLSDDSVDRAFLVTGLRKVAGLDRTLEEVHRVLNPEGQLIVHRRFLFARFLAHQRIVSLCLDAGFDPVASHGTLFHHSLTFEKHHSQDPAQGG
jgi:ubiquinone/menaquinone biosynthesis C-methylase UbiE